MNPIKSLRESHGFSQHDLARLSDVSQQYILRLEQGLFTNVPNDVAEILVNPGPPTTSVWLPPVATQEAIEELSIDYRKWQSKHRQSNLHLLRDALLYLTTRPQDPTLINQFPRFRLYTSESQIGFCKLFCLHPQVVKTFEKKAQRKLSDYLHAALLDAGLTESEIKLLEENLTTVGLKVA